MILNLLLSLLLSSSPRTVAAEPHASNHQTNQEETPGSTLRWGWDAHKMVCTIAWWDMKESTRQAIQTLLKTDAGFDRFMESCLWADEVRGRLPEYDRWTTAHYVNLPRGASAFVLERDCADTLCVVEGIMESRIALRDTTRPTKERLDALKFLSHFIGDIHQPLHAGYADDRGGNDTRVTLFGRDTNVHATWDYGLLEHSGMSWIDYASHLFFQITPNERDDWASDDPALWSKESFDILLKGAYDIGDGQLGESYYEQNIGFVEQRIQQAGVRLADQLDVILGN